LTLKATTFIAANGNKKSPLPASGPFDSNIIWYLMISPAQKEHALEVLESLRRRCGVGLDHEAMDFFYEFAEGVDPL
jgi:hypothetical protein